LYFQEAVVSEQQESAHHELMGGALHVYKRVDSKFWQCATFISGFNHRSSTKEKSLAQAKDIAKDWYLTLLHLPAADGGSGRLSDREKLPDERRDDREVLRVAHQEHDRRGGHQCAESSTAAQI
jgi:hypothetical protein